MLVQVQQHIFQVHQLLTQVAVAQALFQVKLLEMPVQVVAQRVQV
jgi:hypothetical protein